MLSMCGVYFVQEAHSHLIKIGLSSTIHSRLISMQSQSATKLELIGFIRCNSKKDAYEKEKELHNLLVKYNHHAEWFFQEALSIVYMHETLEKSDLISKQMSDSYKNAYISHTHYNQTHKRISIIEEVFNYVKQNKKTDLKRLSNDLCLLESQSKLYVQRLHKRALIDYDMKSNKIVLSEV